MKGEACVSSRKEGGGGRKKNFSREPFPGARFSVGETFIVPTKLLYLSIGKTKASYLFLFPYSPRHVSFRFPVSFFFSLSFLFSLFFFNARHVLLPSPESLLHATRSLILAIFSTSRSANSSRSGRASVHRSGGVVVYFVPVWIDLLAACLPQHGETYVPFSSKLILPERERGKWREGEVVFSNVSSEVRAKF